MKTKSLTKVTLLSILVMAIITAVTLNSCQKESIKPKIVNSTAKSQGLNSLDATSSLVISEANNILFNTGKNSKGLIGGGADTSSCATMTYDTITKPYTVTFNYGSGCLGSDGITRAGQVSISYDDKDIRVVNNTLTATFLNYSMNGTVLNGYISMVNDGPNSNGNQVIAQTGDVVATTGSGTDTLIVNYQNEWLAGEFSSPAANWQFSITGTIHGGSSSAGKSADLTILTALIRNAKTPGCNHYIQGTEQIVGSANPTQFIDFGNPGGCSGQKSVTENGITTVENQ